MAVALTNANSERHSSVHTYQAKPACANIHHDHISDIYLRETSTCYIYTKKIHTRISLFIICH